MKDITKVLIAAKELISSPSSWTRGTLARDVEGHWVASKSERAISWCAVGALDHVCKTDTQWFGAMAILNRVVDNILDTNDRGSHSEVMELFDRAIKRSEEEA